jgi:beta-galactosidase/beta-glucuronidase
MGNSPGGLEEIWNWIYQHEHCCGGYVWGYKNHGFYAEGKDGRARYLYGGDFQDVAHWSNFSLDGFHTSDGTPKPVWLELGEIFAPIFVRWEEDGICIKNTGDFRPLENVVLRWSVKADGVTVRSGEIGLDPLPARGRQKVALPLDTAGLVGCITADCEFYHEDAKLAHKQKLLADLPAPAQELLPFAHTVTVDPDDSHRVTVCGEDFSLELRGGMLAGMMRNGRVVLDTPMAINCWRAYIDNEHGGFGSEVVNNMEEHLVSSMAFGCYTVEVEDTADCVTIQAAGKFLPYCHNWGFHTHITYRITAGGVVDVAIAMDPYGDAPKLLNRVGVRFVLPEAYTHCAWLGCGPGDSYPDRKANAPIGLYEADVETMNFLYDVPQETGNRHGCRRLTVSGGEAPLHIEGQFSFSLHDFAQWNLYKARHRDELETSKEKYLYVDYLQRGLGSKSCGPGPESAYEIPVERFSWSFRIWAE